MFKKLTLAGAAIAMGAASLVPATPAFAQRYDRGYYSDRSDRGYSDRRVYRGSDRSYRNYRARQKCQDGDGGTIIGAIAGGLLGNEVAEGRRGRGDGTAGAIIGAGVGALAGRAIDRDC